MLPTIGMSLPIFLQALDGSSLYELTHYERYRHFSLYDIRDLELIKNPWTNHIAKFLKKTKTNVKHAVVPCFSYTTITATIIR